MVTTEKSDAEWRAQLSDLAYKVTRKHATEPAFSNENFPGGAGMYTCVCCGAPLFDQDAKFDSGTGWPSFWQYLPDAVRTKDDRFLLRVRTEVHCRRCGSHFGHIFNDGPAPTGKRHCLNGVSLVFRAA